LAVLGFELRAGRRSTTLAILEAFFAPVILELGSWVFFAQVILDFDPLILCFPAIVGMTGMHYHTKLFPLKWNVLLFFLH
jgi:hypothetical protein